jgi:glycosyltransferase involved in cell wall biosynthesis
LPDGIVWASCVGLLTGTPVIGTYHGLGILPKGRRRFDPRNVLRGWLYRLMSRLTARTIAVSEPVKELLCRLGLDRRKVVLVPNGADVNRHASPGDCARILTELGLEGKKVVVCVGRLIPGKGQRFLVEGFATVVRRHPETVLLLAGDGPERRALESQIGSLGLAAHIRLLGARDDVAALLAVADAFVLPSLAEGIPLALLEAMAAGTPVVATAVAGNLDVVTDDRYGVLVPPENPSALADAVIGLLEDAGRAQALGESGRMRVREHFDIERMFAATAAIYDEALAGARREGRR